MKIDKGKLAEIIKHLENLKEPIITSEPDYMDQCHINGEINNAISILTPLRHFTGIQHKTVDENIDEECSLKNLTFWTVREMLKDYENWSIDAYNRLVHTSGLHFYPTYNGICFRVKNNEVYRPNILGWVWFHVTTSRLNKSVLKRETSNL